MGEAAAPPLRPAARGAVLRTGAWLAGLAGLWVVANLVSRPLIGHAAVDASFVQLGVIKGLAYGVLAAGLVLVYRATGVINLAHAQIGAFGAVLLAKLVLDYNWPFFPTALLMLLLGAAIAAVVELTVIRRLFDAPRVIILVATIGVAQLLLVAQLSLATPKTLTLDYPAGVEGAFSFLGLHFRGADVLILVVVPVLVLGLGALLSRSRHGLAMRACAENPDAARLAGISPRKVSTAVWVIAGVLASAAAILTGPYTTTLLGPTPALDPGLLLKALAAAMVGRLVSLPLALAGGVGVGVGEAVLQFNVTDPEVADIVLFLGVLLLVLLRARGADQASGSHSLTPHIRPVPARLAGVRLVRLIPLAAGLAGLAVALALPALFPAEANIYLFSEVLLYAMIALSITVVTGWLGQLSLGQFGFVAVGAGVTAALTFRGLPIVAAVAYATILGVIVALAVGMPALRVRGLLLAITTLGFGIAAVATISLLLRKDVLGEHATIRVARPVIGPLDFGSERAYYYLCLTVLVVTVYAVARLRSSGVGRSLLAVRDNEINAAAFSVSPARAKLMCFAVSGGIATLAGALLAGLNLTMRLDAFSVDESLRIIAITVIGGLGSIAGSVLGAIYVLGVPAIFTNAAEEQLLTSGIGLLIMLMYLPGGIAGVLYSSRDALLRAVERRLQPGDAGAAPVGTARRRDSAGDAIDAAPKVGAAPPAPESADRGRDSARDAIDAAPNGEGPAALRVRSATVRFDGRTVLDGVDMTAAPGEVVGLIGANGAGKTTLMNVISGLVPAGGSVELLGRDISRLSAPRRAVAGLGRGFQDARLFTGLTVLECVEIALEAHEHSELVPSLLGLPPSLRSERHKLGEAQRLLTSLGLQDYAGAFVSELSTGTRRIAELACLVALRARVMLLDEPTAGIAQREAEAFGPLIKGIQKQLGATVIVIEHDIPLVLSISDRVYCLEGGRVIAEGLPEAVRHDPRVISSYLGTDDRAIERSGALPVG